MIKQTTPFMKMVGGLVVLGLATVIWVSANAFAAPPVPSVKTTPSNSIEKKDPECVKTCRSRLSACSSSCEANRQQCYSTCGGLFQSRSNCQLNCDEVYGDCSDNCLSTNKQCVSSCPEKKEPKPAPKKSSSKK